MTTLDVDLDDVFSLIVWEDGKAAEYPTSDLAKHGLDTILGVICDSHSDDCDVTLYDIDDEEMATVSVGDIREYIAGQEA